MSLPAGPVAGTLRIALQYKTIVQESITIGQKAESALRGLKCKKVEIGVGGRAWRRRRADDCPVNRQGDPQGAAIPGSGADAFGRGQLPL